MFLQFKLFWQLIRIFFHVKLIFEIWSLWKNILLTCDDFLLTFLIQMFGRKNEMTSKVQNQPLNVFSWNFSSRFWYKRFVRLTLRWPLKFLYVTMRLTQILLSVQKSTPCPLCRGAGLANILMETTLCSGHNLTPMIWIGLTNNYVRPYK